MVIGIDDGDTLTVLTDERERVRVAEVDAPQGDQLRGNRSRQLLSELVFQENVLVRYVGTDQYGRIVASIYAGDTELSAESICLGVA